MQEHIPKAEMIHNMRLHLIEGRRLKRSLAKSLLMDHALMVLGVSVSAFAILAAYIMGFSFGAFFMCAASFFNFYLAMQTFRKDIPIGWEKMAEIKGIIYRLEVLIDAMGDGDGQ